MRKWEHTSHDRQRKGKHVVNQRDSNVTCAVNMDKLLETYLHSIADLTKRGDAREESYYPALKTLLESVAQVLGSVAQVTPLPKKTEVGNPDFRVWDGSHQVIGYIEAKAPGAKLNQVETSEQLQRYQHTFPNLILTDFYEFRLYRQGILVESALLDQQMLKTKLPAKSVQALTHLLKTFFSFALPPILTPEALAVALAQRTRFLRDQVILPELTQQQGVVYRFYEAFQKYLIAGLTEEQFADLYAQTITYGLFAARTRAQGTLNRQLAYSLIPSTIGILRDVFQFISLGKPSPQMEVIVDDITAVLNAADVQAILTQYYRQGKGDDPILHFYETFLVEYDPETRERRGVYYTPQPVVRYIVRAVHHLLQTRFGLADGLADEQVTLLDPAAGTLAFPAEAIRFAFQEFINRYGEGAKGAFRKHILTNFYAFELLMAPYAIGHMKIGFLLETLDIPLQEGDRFQLYLTNALEMEDSQQMTILGLSSLSEETHHAARVKKDKPILVILGNPPYSGFSANQNKWTETLLKTDLDGAQSYYTVDGQPLREKNPKWLQDDYVKFLRFAQWKIHKAGRGIVAMITNHGYLDNPTFRGMRQSLLGTFDEIYLLDLHGNSLKRETAPDGSPDENVFDIRQGVAIALFIKHSDASQRGVYHADLYGRREDKYRWLEEHTLEAAGYRPLAPQSPHYFFIPRQTEDIQHYQTWPQITQIFPLNGVGMTTARDHFAIDFDRPNLLDRIRKFKQSELDDTSLHTDFGIPVKKGWSIRWAWQQLRSVDDEGLKDYIQPVLYRPFDVRFIFYHDAVVSRTVKRVMRHMLAGENLALLVMRQVSLDEDYSHILVTPHIVDNRVFASAKGIALACPLYLYPSTAIPNMFQTAKTPNLADWLLPKLSAAYGFTPTPEEVLAYIYAVFYSPAYRQKYAAELRIDFPRVPFTADPDLFCQMAALGHELIDLHLLRKVPAQTGIKYQGQGSNQIEFVRYDSDSECVFINCDKYFESVTPEMWNYQIGGYQVLEKYLKDRKGRQMDDPVRYIRIAAAIARTMDIQAQIEQLYPQVEANVLQQAA